MVLEHYFYLLKQILLDLLFIFSLCVTATNQVTLSMFYAVGYKVTIFILLVEVESSLVLSHFSISMVFRVVRFVQWFSLESIFMLSKTVYGMGSVLDMFC